LSSYHANERGTTHPPLQEAAGDPARMVEALVDEINDPATGLVTRDFLRAELAEIRGGSPRCAASSPSWGVG
jgi:hypothetical protein